MFLHQQMHTICLLKEEDLEGLSLSFIESLKENAERLKLKVPYAVTLDYLVTFHLCKMLRTGS